MRTLSSPHARRLSGLAAPLAALALLAAPAPAAAQAVGLVCTTGAAGAPTFNLTARPGYITLPDANTMFMWGYAAGDGPFQHPGPVLCVTQGDTVTVVLKNLLPEPVSIMFPGQEGVTANGSPAQPQWSGATLTSLTDTAPPGGSVTYSFVAGRPGTFVYESGTAPHKQVRLGLFGALVVRPADPARMNARADSTFTPGEEFMVLLSEIDPYLHQAVEAGRTFNMNNYHPRYWMLNGRGFPDTVADNFVDWLPSQPYGALARIHPFDPTGHPWPGSIRYLNVGSESFPFHPHGNNGLVIGRDGRALESATGQDLSFEKFAVNVGPGQTWDVLFRWYDAEAYSEANPVPVTVPDPANLQFGPWYSGSPYLGVLGPLLPNANTLNQCGEYYVISHNHALFQITAWGMTMAGPITYVRVDPPLPNACP
ncbi:MAG: multicopper oxidase domain-containing protein [Deltaproteobacteria bacterium]|nr:multicopper oxidase domain-containing protein [Deltaproteobacteria bacterium]